MCVAPYSIPNPNYCMDKAVPRGYAFLKDTKSAYINIPCGHCDECIANKQMQIVQRVQMEALHNHLFMCTLTYNEEMLPRYECSSGFTLRYAELSDVQKMIKRLRKNNSFPRPFRYFGVSERGSKRMRPHFHILWLIPKESGDSFLDCYSLESQLWRIVLDNWTRNVGSHKKPLYKPCCTYRKKYVGKKLYSNYDLHWVNPSATEAGVADVGFYVLKYMTKPSKKEEALRSALKLNLPLEEFYDAWNKVHSRWFASKDFGLANSPDVQSYLRDCISKTPVGSSYPYYFNPVSGQSFPLARFYRNKPAIYGIDDALTIYFNSKDEYHDINRDQQLKKWNEYIHKTDLAFERGDSVFFDDLED